MSIVELKITFADLNAPAAFIYFERTVDWSPDLVQAFFEQNKNVFGPGAERIEQSGEFVDHAAADAHVRAMSIDNWNHRDIYLWPPQVVGPVVQDDITVDHPAHQQMETIPTTQGHLSSNVDIFEFKFENPLATIIDHDSTISVIDKVMTSGIGAPHHCQSQVPTELRAGFEIEAAVTKVDGYSYRDIMPQDPAGAEPIGLAGYEPDAEELSPEYQAEHFPNG